MSELVERLTQGKSRLVFGRPERPDRAGDLKAAVERKYVILRFTDTRGGTELGVPLDEAVAQRAADDLSAKRGRIHLEGILKLDYVPVRMIAELDPTSFEGEGRIEVVAAAAD